MHDRLAAGSEPAACEADRVTQLAEGSVVVEGFGGTGLPDSFERSVHSSELLEEADVGVLVRPWLHVIDELLELSPTISDPQEVAARNRNRLGHADLRPLEPFPQAPQSRDPSAAGPGPVNPEDNRRLSVYPQVEVEITADVCPSGPARDAVDQGRDGRIICAGSRSEPARQGGGRGRSFASGHGNGPSAHPTKGPPGEPILLDADRFGICLASAVLLSGRAARSSGVIPEPRVRAVRDQRDCPRAWSVQRLSRRDQSGGVPRSGRRVQTARRGRGATPPALGLLPLSSPDGARFRGGRREAVRDPGGRQTLRPGSAVSGLGARGALRRERGEGDIRSGAGLWGG